MKKETYAFEISTMIAQFIDMYDDVIIRRYNESKEVQDRIQVNFVYAPKNRVLHDLINKAGHIKLPIIAVSLGGFNRNPNRVFNKLDGPMYNTDPRTSPTFSKGYQPVPIDITINMSIISRFQSDMDQILTNFIPYNDNYTVMSWTAPHTDLELRNVVKWSGSVSLNYPNDLTAQTAYRCIADTSFVIEGWLFKKPDSPVGMIYNVDLSFSALSSINKKYEQLVAEEDEYNTDEFYILGRPQPTLVEPYLTIPCLSGVPFVLEGKSMDTVSDLFISATSGVYATSFIYPHSGNSLVSADFTGFSGISVDDWSYNAGSQAIEFVLPQPLSAGYIDLIASNEAGYGVLTVDSVRPTFNPYISGTWEYDNYVQYQHPSISGIYVAPVYHECS